MNFIGLWSLALLGSQFTSVIATPLRVPQVPFAEPSLLPQDETVQKWTSQDVKDQEMAKLLNQYAPIFKLSKDERYFPSSVDYMLPHYSFIEDVSGDTYPANHTILTPCHLDTLPLAGAYLFLSINEPHNPQPSLLEKESHYLYGPAGQEEELEKRKKNNERGRIEEPVYGFWVDQNRGVVDLWYWAFYPLNFGKPAGRLGILGNHVADWEHLRVRIVDGVPVSADYSTHEGGRLSAGTVRWEEVEKVHDRPVAYVAMGSHGLGNIFKIVDKTDDEGPIWDTLDNVIPVRYWANAHDRTRVRHAGKDSWRNFKGRWGNKGETDCWWHPITGFCQVVDAPPGPNRDFGVPPECIVAPRATEYSTYNFYLSSHAVEWAEENGITMVEVEQTCERPRRGKGDDDTSVEDVETWSTKGLILFRGKDQHSAHLPECKGVQSSVRGYRISLCLINGQCLTTSRERRICSYEPGERGNKPGGAVIVNDIDDWRWNY
ncbi:hypothetical protein CNBE4290 [Cryptococcus deneoformans B-3501A]|uniref:hypothetical protein n=1 Tax=Cryptococcus deneoformans (strain B-3501A) TaxID=283643 RepID=UPI000042F426|nr:hypothetical protein CNBE4290 [Cryptococcus neoformans var. neoformans B-3501A]EAL20509.1 hypothetical protein CNBE4290 [Cryptococcus neoformans var. neoformans B-3501A]